MPSTLSLLASRISARKAEVEAEYAIQIRAHLVSLFRRAYAIEPTLTGMICGNGTAVARGSFVEVEGAETWQTKARDYNRNSRSQPKNRSTRLWLEAVSAYAERVGQTLPYVNDITVADVESVSERRAAIWLNAARAMQA